MELRRTQFHLWSETLSRKINFVCENRQIRDERTLINITHCLWLQDFRKTKPFSSSYRANATENYITIDSA